MLKKFKKINLDQVKEFLFNHGEKAALGTCIFLALLFGSMGLLRALSAGRDGKSGHTWKEELTNQYQSISTNMTSAQPAPLDKATEEKLGTKPYEWQPWISDFITGPYIWMQDKFASNKRENPLAMTIKTGKKTVKLDYVRAPVLTYEYDAAKRIVKGVADNNGKEKAVGNAEGGPIRFLRAAQPRRFVVGSAVFPMKQQVEEYVRALRMKGQAELFSNPDNLPKFLGINVVRYEVLAGGKLGKAEIVVYHDPQTKQLKMSETLRKFLRDAIYDEGVAEALAPYLYDGLDMPIPMIAGRSYPSLDLDGIKVDLSQTGESKQPGDGTTPRRTNPGGAGSGVTVGGRNSKVESKKDKDSPPALPELTVEPIAQDRLKDADPELAERLFGNDFNLFHVLGQPAPAADEKGAVPNPQQPGQVAGKNRFHDGFLLKTDAALNMKGPLDRQKFKKGKEPMQGGATETVQWDRDALVRFIDTDIEPGKTYQYAIQVRLKNPNFNKKDEVQFHALANVEELPPPADSAKYWVTTLPITIPSEYFVYAVDQPLLDAWAAGKAAPTHDLKQSKDHTSFQVHQWIKTKEDLASREQYVIGDWAIAEHLFVRKGEYIGLNAVVKVPVWQKTKDAFEVPERIKEGKSKTLKPGIKIDLLPPVKGDESVLPPVLVDFFGGKRLKGSALEEETAVEALIMSADGGLMVFNSRDDSDPSLPRPIARQKRVVSMRERVEEVQRGAK